MNEKMLAYIKKYLGEGHPLEQIRQSLLSQGFPDQDIKEAALSVMGGQGEVKKSGHPKTGLIITIILLLLVGGAVYYFWADITPIIDQLMGEKNIELNTTDTGTDINPPGENTPGDISGSGGNPAQSSLCNMDCLVQAAAICEPKNSYQNASVDFFGMMINTERYYEIRPGEKCQLYIRTDDYWVTINEETRQYLLSEGVSEEDIQTQIKDMETYKGEIVGKEGICTFESPDKLQQYLQKLRDGNFDGGVSCSMVGDCKITVNETGRHESERCANMTWECTSTGDAALGDCTGTMFLPSPVGNV